MLVRGGVEEEEKRRGLFESVVGYKYIEIYGLLSFAEEGKFVSFLSKGDAATPLLELGVVSCCAPMSVEYIVAQ